METASTNIRHTNYISRNPLIRSLLKNFLIKVSHLLTSINAVEKNGLDVGCGEGHLLGYMYDQGVIGHLKAIDIDHCDLIFANKHFPCANYQVADCCNLPFPEDRFDYIMSTEVFEHLPDPVRAMTELRRVAKPDAFLIISVPFEPFFHWGNLIRGKYWDRRGYTPNHLNLWKRNEFISFLEPFVEIEIDLNTKTFPWLLYRCRFK